MCVRWADKSAQGATKNMLPVCIRFPSHDPNHSSPESMAALCLGDCGDSGDDVRQALGPELLAEILNFKTIAFESKEYPVLLTLGSDLKAILSCANQASASSKHCCFKCCKSRDQFGSASCGKSVARSLAMHKRLAHLAVGERCPSPTCAFHLTPLTWQAKLDAEGMSEAQAQSHQAGHFGIFPGRESVFGIEPKMCVASIRACL
jgi:hypothetical protein